MNITTKFAKVGFALLALLFFTGISNAALTIIPVNDKASFDTARSSAVWNGQLRMATSGDEFGIVNGGALASPTDDHDVWGMRNNFQVSDSSTMSVSIISDGSTLTWSLGDNVSAVSGTFSETSTINHTGFNSFTTLWLGVNSKLPNNRFSMINTALNGENIATTEANGAQFRGFYVPVGESFSVLLDLQAVHEGGFPEHYSSYDAAFYIFGDNTTVPEPSTSFLIGLASAIVLFRRKRE